VDSALEDARDQIDLATMSWPIEEVIVLGQMIGIVEAIHEADQDEPTALEEPHDAGVMLASGRTLVSLVGGYVRKPFAEAVRTFAAKKVIPREMFDDMRAEAKRRAFTVAGLATTHQLKIAKDEVQKALANGDSPHTFAKRLEARFASAGVTGVSTSHAETILQNATMSAFADGRFAQMTRPEVLSERPYWQVQCRNDQHTRYCHREQHGKVVRGDEVAAAQKRLPWGHRCRCRFVSLTERQVKQRGLVPVPATMLAGVPDQGWNS
jgi:SPP1 gp7 family putative phage head morphogenesis protein